MSDEEKKELEELRKAIRPFLEAYELHKDDSPLSKRKFNMTLNVRMEDWDALVEVVKRHERAD